jgi:hypothetical protein
MDAPFSEREAWVWLIAEAAWKPREKRVGKVIVTLDRGQLAHSTRFLADAWQWTHSRVRRFLERLENRHMIERQSDTGVSVICIMKYDTYQYNAQSSGTPVEHEPAQQRHSSGTNDKKVNKDKKEEEERDTNVSLRVVKADPDGFEEFWQEVPRKAGKGSARKAYAQAIKKADPQTLIAAIQRYAEERRGKDEKYTAHPATWLNAERWLDAPPKAGASDFHDQLSAALGGDNGLPAAIADHHGQTQHVPARIPAPRTPDDRTGVAGDTQIGGRGEQAYRRLNRG